MSINVFFDTILPSTGLRCVAWKTPTGWAHRWGPDNAWLAKAALYIDTTKNKDVYYGCSSFLPQAQDSQRDPATRKLIIGGRKQTNVALVRSFWVDLDVGPPEEGKPPKYATQREAGAAIFRFAIAHKMPMPWLVDSGWGVHAYWPMDADMLASDWKPVAEGLKGALRDAGVLFDPSRTADEASVLRPPGTHNYKRTPKLVRVIHAGKVWTFAEMAAAFPPIGTASVYPGVNVPLTLNAALGGGMGPEPSSALLMAEHCGVMALIRDTRGNVDQPTWYHALGVLAQTDEAPAICHAWSAGHPNYTAAETDAALARVSQHGPTTCVKFADHQPVICKACPHWKKITSPIQLGREKAHPTTVEQVERTVDKKGFVTEKKTEIALPHGYGIEHHSGRRVLTFLVPETPGTDTKPGKPAEKVVVSETFIVGRSRLQIDGLAYTEWEADTREGPRLFVTPNGKLSGSWRDMAGPLGEQEVYARTGKERLLETYLKNWMQTLRDTAPLTKAYQSFGWTADGFVLGDAVLQADGGEVRAVLGGTARDKQDVVASKGDLATWVKLVDRAYNAPGQEAFQFQLGCAFAAPLISLMHQISGVTVYAHSAGSGVGKTTVQKVGLSVWGRWDKMMLAQGHATGNALWQLLGGYNNLPVVYDELTNASNQEVSELVFAVSSGRAKERLAADGKLRTNSSNWSTIMLASGNTLLSEKLSQHRANTEAEIARLFEFTLTHADHLTVGEANILFPQFSEHYGHAGHAFAAYVTPRKGKVTKLLHQTLAEVNTEFDIGPVERHWATLFAAVLVALRICRGLRLMSFEIEPIKAWMADQLAENRGQSVAAAPDYTELLGQMINELWADVLITSGQGDLRPTGIPASVVKDPKSGSMVGRLILPTQNDPTHMLLLSRYDIRQWCSKRQTSPKDLWEKALAAGMVHPVIKRHCLGRGAKLYQSTDNVYCWQFFPTALAPSLADDVASKLTLVQGGKP